MDNQNVVNSSAELTLGDIETGAKEAMKRVMSYPSWERLSSETQRALFYYQAYCDGKAGARVTLDITGLTSQAEREDIKEDWGVFMIGAPKQEAKKTEQNRPTQTWETRAQELARKYHERRY